MCRVILTAIAFAYLICLLILSGVQKEELDVNTLRKLQRHNVNIDDMSDPKVQQECMFSTITQPKTTRENMSNFVITTRTPFIKEVETTPTTTTRITNLDAIMKYFLHTTESATEKVTTNLDDILRSERINLYIRSKMINDEVTNRPVMKTVNSNSDNVENVLKFWRKLDKEYTAAKAEEDKIKYEVKQHMPQTFAYSANKYVYTGPSVDTINRFLSEYISRESNPVVTSPAATTTTVYLDKIMAQISEFLKQNVSNNGNYGKQENIINIQNPKDNAAITQVRNILQQRRFPENMNPNYITKIEVDPKENPTNPRNNAQNVQGVQRAVDNSKDFVAAFPPNALTEIAENIKNLVLKNLRKELMSSTSTTTPTTTPKVTTTIKEQDAPKQDKKNEVDVQNAAQVIENIMALFEQFKTIKESTVITKDSKYKVTEKKHIKRLYHKPTDDKTHNAKQTKVKTKPINKQLYTMPSIMVQQKLIPNNMNLPDLRNYQTPYQDMKQAPIPFQMPAPIMLQTNSNEIRPLVVPLSKPLNLINQNIVITTSKPKTSNERNIWSHMTINSNHVQQFPIAKTKPPNKEKPKVVNRLGIKFKKRQPGTSYQQSKIRYGSLKTQFPKLNEEKRTPNKQESKTVYYLPKFETKLNRDIVKFHDLLGEKDRKNNERRGEGEPIGVRVSERHVQPLDEAKRYDDTHYEKLIRTQERVNDMLEKMLAAKSHNSFEVETFDL